MELNKIEALLTKYHKGETTILEEQQLKNYFSQQTIAPHLEAYKPLFAYFVQNKKEQYHKKIALQSNRTNWYTWVGIAAILVVSLSIYFNKTSLENSYGTYSPDEKEMAFNQVKKSLQLISTHLNKGASSMQYLNEVENTTSLIFKK